MPLLRVEGLAKYFHINHLQRVIGVFRNLSFMLDEGQFLLVTGVNGAGKSSLLRCLYRTYVPSEGRILYEARGGRIDLVTAADVDVLHLRQAEIGFVTQFLRARPRVSAVELVMEPLLDDGVSSDEAQAQAEQMLDNFGLKRDVWDEYPTMFSGGEQQKVNLARALIRPRRLLLLDEPAASLDRTAREQLVTRMSELKAQGVTLIGVFHHPEIIQHLVDHEIALSAAVVAEMNGAGEHVDS